jgi:hypothetical protein
LHNNKKIDYKYTWYDTSATCFGLQSPTLGKRLTKVKLVWPIILEMYRYKAKIDVLYNFFYQCSTALVGHSLFVEDSWSR